MVNAAQRQRKLAAKAARRKAVVAEKKKIEMTASSLAGRIKLAAKGPIVLCTMPPGLFDTGMGLPAAKDIPAVEVIFGTVDAGACTETFTFGRDGKPFYIPGPTDALARMRAGAQALEKSRGTGNWDFMIGVEPEL